MQSWIFGHLVTKKIAKVLNPCITKQETGGTYFIQFNLFLRNEDIHMSQYEIKYCISNTSIQNKRIVTSI